MTPEFATIRQPEHPVYALTTYELAWLPAQARENTHRPSRARSGQRAGPAAARRGTGRTGRPDGNRPQVGDPVTSLPRPEEAVRLTTVLQEHPRWSAFWDKRYRVWRVSEDDPDSDLYAESGDVDQVISYVMTHS